MYASSIYYISVLFILFSHKFILILKCLLLRNWRLFPICPIIIPLRQVIPWFHCEITFTSFQVDIPITLFTLTSHAPSRLRVTYVGWLCDSSTFVCPMSGYQIYYLVELTPLGKIVKIMHMPAIDWSPAANVMAVWRRRWRWWWMQIAYKLR